MPKTQDLFDDSTMSFGEHLEILRVHLWKAIVGLAIAVAVALFVGDKVINIVRGPIDRALQEFGLSTEDDLGGFDFIDWLKGTILGTGKPTDGRTITDAAVDSLIKFPNLKEVSLVSANLTAEGLRKLQKTHPELEINFDPLVVVGLGHLQSRGARCELDDNFDAIALSLRGTEATADDLELVKKLISLKRLDLQGLEIEDEALNVLENLTALEFLNLSGTGITGAGLEKLKKLSSLKRLDIRRTTVTDEKLGDLKKLKSLEHLDLRNTEVTDTGLKQVGELKKLQALFLSGGKITDEGMVHLKDLTELKQLEFKETAVTNAGLKHLESLSKLEVLNFTKGPIANDQFAGDLSPEMMDDYTINVQIRALQLAEILHQIDPETYPAPTAEFEDRPVTMPLAAWEFKEFRETAVNARKPVTLNVQEAFVTYLKVAFVAGLLLASPWVFYQLWLFVATGLYPHERKYIYVYLPLSLTLFVGGAVFCF